MGVSGVCDDFVVKLVFDVCVDVVDSRWLGYEVQAC